MNNPFRVVHFLSKEFLNKKGIRKTNPFLIFLHFGLIQNLNLMRNFRNFV
jgi:hypothetical protein